MSGPRRRWDDEQRLPPWVIQMFGLMLTLGCFAVGFITGEVSPLLLSAAIGLVSAGSLKAVTQNVRRKRTEIRAVTDGRRENDVVEDGDE